MSLVVSEKLDEGATAVLERTPSIDVHTTFPAGGGEMGEAIRRHDWSATALGHPATWPSTLRNAVNLILNSPESLLLAWGPDLRLFFNDTYRPLLGPRVSFALGAPMTEVWDDVWEQVRPIAEKALAGEASRFDDLPLRMARQGTMEETWWSFSYAPIYGDEGTVAGLFIVTNETTQRVRSERSLQDLNTSLSAQVAERTADRDRLWRLSTDVMLVARFDGMIVATNPAWEAVLGWSEEHLRGRDLFDLIHPDDREPSEAAATDVADGVTVWRFDNRYAHADGSYRWLSWTAVPGDGMINAVGRDVTCEKEQALTLAASEEALRQSQKMEAVGQLTGGVAHDFNNLLTVIRSSVDLLRRPGIAEERKRRYLDAMSDTVDRAAKLTGQLLAVNRPSNLGLTQSR